VVVVVAPTAGVGVSLPPTCACLSRSAVPPLAPAVLATARGLAAKCRSAAVLGGADGRTACWSAHLSNMQPL
jgi:hypothetical protein